MYTYILKCQTTSRSTGHTVTATDGGATRTPALLAADQAQPSGPPPTWPQNIGATTAEAVGGGGGVLSNLH